MADTLTRIEVNCETGEQKVVELTADDIAQLEKDRAESAIRRAEQEAEAKAKAEAKASALTKLEALGLTEEEAAALIS